MFLPFAVLSLPMTTVSAVNDSAPTNTTSYRFPLYFDKRAQDKGQLSCGTWNATYQDPVTDTLRGQYANHREVCCVRVSGARDRRDTDTLSCRVGPEQQLLFDRCANTSNCAPFEHAVD